MLVNYIREYQIDRGVPAAQAYNVTMYVLAGLLVLGFFCNLAVRPVEERWLMTETRARARSGHCCGASPPRGEPSRGERCINYTPAEY